MCLALDMRPEEVGSDSLRSSLANVESRRAKLHRHRRNKGVGERILPSVPCVLFLWTIIKYYFNFIPNQYQYWYYQLVLQYQNEV